MDDTDCLHYMLMLTLSDILKGLLEISPERRLTLEEASRHPWVMRYGHIKYR